MKVEKLIKSWNLSSFLHNTKIRFYVKEHSNHYLCYGEPTRVLISSDIPVTELHPAWLEYEAEDWWFNEDIEHGIYYVNFLLKGVIINDK